MDPTSVRNLEERVVRALEASSNRSTLTPRFDEIALEATLSEPNAAARPTELVEQTMRDVEHVADEMVDEIARLRAQSAQLDELLVAAAADVERSLRGLTRSRQALPPDVDLSRMLARVADHRKQSRRLDERLALLERGARACAAACRGRAVAAV